MDTDSDMCHVESLSHPTRVKDFTATISLSSVMFPRTSM